MNDEKLAGIKESDLVKLGPCAVCRKRLFDSGGVGLTFYRVKIERAACDMKAIQRRVGLGIMVGSDPIARALSPDDDLAKVFDGPVEVMVHEACAHEIHSLMQLFPEKAGA